MEMKHSKGTGSAGLMVAVFIILIVGGSVFVYVYKAQQEIPGLKTFNSCGELQGALMEAYSQRMLGQWTKGGMFIETTLPMSATVGESGEAPDYSQTNVQVEGVDEADIVKTDGEYIYTLSQERMIIAKAYPAQDAQVLSETDLDISPREIFIHNDKVMIFGYNYSVPIFVGGGVAIDIYPHYSSFTVVQVWDTTDKANPELERTLEFEGNYVSSRKIGPDVYFVVNSYPRYQILGESGNITNIDVMLPRFRDSSVSEEFVPACGCGEVQYFEPINPQNFITVASLSLEDPEGEVNKKVILGSGQNIYASQENLYIAEMNYPFWRYWAEEGVPQETTIVHKFSLDSGNVNYRGYGEAPGRILNQFSMDEYNGYFRIATTIGHVSRTGGGSTNNVYVFNNNMNITGKLEDLAPGERIYSVRFMGEKGYLVTFKKIDPLFVIDLSDPNNPRVLGKLKIPGYSDYLHPYDENHIIGIGKETVEAEQGDFAWYQGVKMAIFDVSDVENPIELHKVVIGDRGTDSEVLSDHKAFLFDRDRNLLVLPILLAEIVGDKSTLPPNTYGDYVYQGAYVYDLTLENGFVLKGRVTHYDSDEPFLHSGYYFRDTGYSITRSLYIDNVLYTISENMIKMNSLDNLEEINSLDFGS